MHIAHLIDSLVIGGAQKLLVIFAEEAKLRALKVTVISLTTQGSNDGLIAELESLGVRVVFLTINKLYDPTALPKLLKVLRNERIDVMQTHLRHSNILGVLAGKLINIPVIGTLHSTHFYPNGRFSRLRFSSEQFLLRFGADRVIAVGQMTAEIYRNRLVGRKLVIVSNPVKRSPGLSREQRNSLRHEIAGDSQRSLVLTVGRLEPEKGLLDLLSAFAQVSEKHPSVMLIVVGDGEMLGELKSLAASLDMLDDVRFTGMRNDVPALMSASDIYVSSSYREGLSLAMLEAMAAGLPILATKVGDTEFLLKDGRGLMVAPHDMPALVNGMCYLIENPMRMKEIGGAARRFVEANYSPGQWMEKLLGIYEQARNYAN